MKTIIINLSDILPVDIHKSIRAFIHLRKANTERCCGLATYATTLFGVTDSPYVKGVLFAANRSLIPQYRTGKITTEEFMQGCLYYYFPQPAQYDKEDWDNRLKQAWNMMIEVDSAKMNGFLDTIKNNPEINFIVITNSNDLHIAYFRKKLAELFEVTFTSDLEGKMLRCNEFENLTLYSSHMMQQFKTNGMIEKIIETRELNPSETTVCTRYEDDRAKAEEIGCKGSKIDASFNYRLCFLTPCLAMHREIYTVL